MTDKNIMSVIVVAMYDAKGKLISVNMQNTKIPSFGFDTLGISNLSVPDSCAKVKWFLWNLDNINPF